jgi:hypothetical protein
LALSVRNRCNVVEHPGRRNRDPFVLLAGIVLASVGLATASHAEPAVLAVELNKLEPTDKGCRAYLVINNTSDTAYQAVKLDLVMFQPDGVIGKRFVLDIAPLKPQKKTVKLFDLEATACDKVGGLLVNDIVECKAESGPLSDCLSKMSLSTLTGVTLSK